jgi:two-component system phosphate regulon sensor histidine kinase PhoR
LALQTLSSRKLSSDQTQSLVDKAISENDRLKILIDNIIHASSIENKGLTLDKSELDLKMILSQIVKKSNQRLEKPLVNLDFEGSVKLIADKFMIETSIINIIENAIKYGGEYQIDVVARTKGNRCLISVTDQGPGITENEQSNIFDKFYRIGNEETRTKKGSGLGLYIAKQFIELHNGNIQYKRNKPSGSIFTISIPNGK